MPPRWSITTRHARRVPAARRSAGSCGPGRSRVASNRCSPWPARSIQEPRVLLIDEMSMGLAPLIVRVALRHRPADRPRPRLRGAARRAARPTRARGRRQRGGPQPRLDRAARPGVRAPGRRTPTPGRLPRRGRADRELTRVDWSAHLRRDAGVVGRRRTRSATTTHLPTCPDWDVADLLRHVGSVHYRAALIIGEHREPRAGSTARPARRRATRSAWYEQGRSALFARAWRHVDRVGAYWTFRGPKPLDWWLRRLAHETAIHRVDAELAGRPGSDRSRLRGGRRRRAARDVPPGRRGEAATRQRRCEGVAACDRRRRRVDGDVTVAGEVTVARDEEPAAACIRRAGGRPLPVAVATRARRMPWPSRVMPRPSDCLRTAAEV